MSYGTKQNNFGVPGPISKMRVILDGNLPAALLLYRVYGRFKYSKKFLNRHGKKWIAMTSNQWATESGLTPAQFRNTAVPILKKEKFVEIRAMCLRPSQPKLMWFSLDMPAIMKMLEYYNPQDVGLSMQFAFGTGNAEKAVKEQLSVVEAEREKLKLLSNKLEFIKKGIAEGK